ncbi:MAG: hypothetical protein SFU27_06480 [Thermonemataceae bacterium]|nr:hypothetical protein [Thermonemataceae bacterium]
MKKKIIIGTIAFFVLLAIILPKEKEEKKTSENKTEQKKEVENKEISIGEKLEKQLLSYNKFDSKEHRGSIGGITTEIVLLNIWAEQIKEGKSSQDQKVKDLALKCEQKQSILQSKEFPEMRKEWTKLVHRALWEMDISVSNCIGNTDVICFTGSAFATNKNKKTTLEQYKEMLSHLRFKQVQFRWYENADDFTYFDLNPPKDTEVIQSL